MSTVRIEGPKGPRGPEGHRGDKGHRGDRGPTGPVGGATGATGSTGSSGATGATGSSSVQGLAAYGYAVGQNSNTIAANSDVVFDLGGAAFPNVGLTPPAPGGSSFTILSTGDYEYNFHVVGPHDNAATTSMEIALFVNGVSAGVAHEFRSNQQASLADVQLLRGQGIIHLLAGDVVTIRNRTGAGTVKIDVSNIAPGGEASANRTLSLKKLSP